MTTSAPTHGPAANGSSHGAHGSHNGSSHGAHHGGPSQDGSGNGSADEFHPEFGEGLDPVTGSIADSVDLWPNGGGYGASAPRYGGAHAPNQPFAGRPAGPARPASAASVFTPRPQSSRDRAAEQAEQSRDRTGGAADTWDIREAFLNLAAGRLTDTARNDAARAHAFLTQFGFEAEDIAKLHFGLYPDPAEVEEYLKRCGFAEEAVRNSGLTRDRRGDRRTDWAGCLVLPIDDETGRCVDLAVIDPTPGPHRVMQVGLVRGADESGVVAYGLRSALQEQRGDRKGTLTLTEDLLEACLLNARGFGPVAAIGGEGSAFVARRWEELARLGIGSVTLAFREDDGRHDAVRDCLVHALRARTAPEVYVLEPTGPADCETLAETVRVHGVAAAERRLAHRSLAFHGKDFGAAPRQGGLPDWAHREPAPARPERAAPAPKPQPRFNRTPQPQPQRDSLGDFRERVRAELARLPHGVERRAAAELFAEVDAALAARDFDRARDLLSRAFAVTRAERAENGRSRYTAYGEAGTWGEGANPHREPLNDESGRSWFSAPGRTDGHARAWAFDGYRGEERDATSCTLSTILDELCNAGRGPVICDRLHGETAAAIRPGSLTALTAADPAASLAMVCDRVADALDRCDHAPLTVILRDASPGAFTAMLIAHLTARLNGGHGLTAGEVDARLAGRDADHHYTAKPWLADEAADRLRTHGDRLRVVDARGAAFGEVLHTLTRTGSLHARGSQAEGQNPHAGGVLCDAATADELSRLAEFAAETGCWALAATAPCTPVQHTEPVWYAADARGSWQPERPTRNRSVEREARESARLRQFRDLVGEWIARAAA
ncbi:hypothetical protein [Alienimonas californiensis]|uniref:Uncharacterized protein n=1 Tax=Alienimonas californiensis TaxID=2527989 RepID=A0A517P5C3_9PLAN|nr:hypothetical protein [Alienimonas californiensis]QDT14572.1 hypothetical protein CA12_06470 [Alienimonas californiensis]